MSDINSLVFEALEEGIFNPDGKGGYVKVGDPSGKSHHFNIQKVAFPKHGDSKPKGIYLRGADHFAKMFNRTKSLKKPQSGFAFA